jgi:cation diffusion facilitator CzcD-associated flavoprotein CzcO
VTPPEHVDVLVVGAGLAGIGLAGRVLAAFPWRSCAVLEARGALGGTWDLFRFPGVRSDSDMYTLAYRDRPWRGERSLAAGADILAYLQRAAHETGVEGRIRYHHKVVGASWSSQEARWTVEVNRLDTQETVRFTTSLLLMCTGYYRYDEGYTPPLPGLDRFAGPVVHPQLWPSDLDHAGRRVVVVGSGATAMTLAPALAERAAKVTIVQRSPSYVLSRPGADPLAERLRRLPSRTASWLLRWKNILLQTATYRLARWRPRTMRRLLRSATARLLPEGYPVDVHFRPRYAPWDQRLCLVPDADLFRCLADGRVEMVTDTIETFTESGVLLTSGRHVPADVVVTATGLALLALGEVSLTVDDQPVRLADTLVYRGMMLGGVPNLVFVLGYVNASWTLKVDLVAEYVVRLLRHLDRTGATVAVPRPEPGMTTRPLMDLTSGYILRSLDSFPRQGDRGAWRMRTSYLRDLVDVRRRPVEDGVLRLSSPTGGEPADAPAGSRSGPRDHDVTRRPG